MRLVQVITDYIRRSILTTEGDIVIFGRAGVERFPAGPLGTVLTGRDVGQKPAWQAPVMPTTSFMSGYFQRLSAGYEVVTGLGFAPKAITFYAADNQALQQNFSWGSDDGSNHQCVYAADDMSYNTFGISYSIMCRRTSSNFIYGLVDAFSSDGFTVRFWITGSVRVNVIWTAMG